MSNFVGFQHVLFVLQELKTGNKMPYIIYSPESLRRMKHTLFDLLDVSGNGRRKIMRIQCESHQAQLYSRRLDVEKSWPKQKIIIHHRFIDACERSITYKIFFTLMDLPRADQLGDREGLYEANRAMANSLRNCQVARLKNYHSACGDSRTYIDSIKKITSIPHGLPTRQSNSML